MSLITEEIKAKAEYYSGDEICKVKSKELLREVGMPNGLLPLRDIEECGYVRETGFVWLKQKKSITHKFEKIGRYVSYATEVTAYVERHKIKKLTGVKTKELLIWITLSDIYIDDPASGKITFQTPAGLSRTFPVSAFQVQEEEVTEAKEPNEVKQAMESKEPDEAKQAMESKEPGEVKQAKESKEPSEVKQAKEVNAAVEVKEA